MSAERAWDVRWRDDPKEVADERQRIEKRTHSIWTTPMIDRLELPSSQHALAGSVNRVGRPSNS